MSQIRAKSRTGSHRFYIVDVFGEEKYSGNQLAVVLPEGNIPDVDMQKIAREFNFPETTFVTGLRKRRGGYDVRIFTPKREVPFAGHPVLGTAHILRKAVGKGAPSILLNLKIGPVPVRFEDMNAGGKGGGLLWMRQPRPVFGRVHDSKAIAKTVSLTARDLDPGFPVQEVSTGLPFLLVPLRSLAAVSKAANDPGAYRRYFAGRDPLPTFIFCRETVFLANQIHARMFADVFGIPEDPATGSASGCLAGYISKHRYFGSRDTAVRVEQGYEMGRKSLLHIRAGTTGRIIDVHVGGRVFDVAEGRLS